MGLGFWNFGIICILFLQYGCVLPTPFRLRLNASFYESRQNIFASTEIRSANSDKPKRKNIW